MLKLADKLTPEKVDEILSRILPHEKSPRRRMNKLESFIFTKAQEDRLWLENYLLSKNNVLAEGDLNDAEMQTFVISIAMLFEFEVWLKDAEYWKERKCDKMPEVYEERIMDIQPCRWLARFGQNRGRKTSKNVGGCIFDALLGRRVEKGEPLTIKDVTYDVAMIVSWHPELENNDKVSECRWSTELEDWDLVVIKPDGRIIGTPTKTIEDVVKEGIIARSKTVGMSGRKLILNDAFLGLLVGNQSTEKLA